MRVTSPLLNLVFNHTDWAVRFLYCQLGPVSSLLNKLFFWKLYSSGDPAGVDDKFHLMLDFFQRNGVAIKGKTVLEIGPGNSLINTYNLLLLGAKKIQLIDKFPRYILTGKQRRYWQSEIDYFTQKHDRDDLAFLDDTLHIKPELAEFTTGEITTLPTGHQYDVIFSQGVLEHVRSIRENIEAMGNLIAPGGYVYHYINMLDHYNFNAPFLFYKYSDEVWNRWLTREGVSYTNRWRYQDYINAFRSAGLHVIDQKIERYSVTTKSIHPKFRQRDDLDIGMVYLLLRKER